MAAGEEEFWRLDPGAKAESIARDIDVLMARARAAGFSVTAYLQLAAQEGLDNDGPNVTTT
jgi:hypothetical protein